MRPNWTPDDLPNLRGQTAIVTGGNAGVGYYTALELAMHGAKVIIGSRDPRRGEEAIIKMKQTAPNVDVTVEPLNLAHLKSVRSFADTIHGKVKGIDVLINNAGVMAVPTRELTADGFEMHFGTNHLGHFALTGLLLPLIEKNHGRIVTVSAQSAQMGDIDFSDLRMDKKYRPMAGYNRSKLSNILFARELNRRAKKKGITSIAVHPGTSPTGIGRNAPKGTKAFGLLLMKIFGTPPDQSSWPSLIAATDSTITGDIYVGLGMNPLKAKKPKFVDFPKKALDVQLAERLWLLSEKLTGVHYDL
ncbi:SDR family NAD(P)-dependent oxidoreductase [Paenibacillus xylanexedens]|uniref:oxidoreductase n=1 Tax=Paenibacillus xylanexedens TaxID=528191 RepID=UPI001F010F70|nr:oxidoreductase [Paenibacillus xylanexedens]MCF7754098.1 SDR family NAD(P)-dependent oxidoreductase [Paenibacillus xylanexedens]